MQYGYFDDDSHEYVITNPRTPLKWINYLGTLSFGGIIDHTGGMLICKGDPARNRITKYIPQLPASDFKGGTLYLRLRQGDDYQTFSPFFVPTLDRYDRYQCHVGMGYQRIVSSFYGIHTSATFFVPPDDTRVIWDIKITNLGDEAQTLDAVPVVEYTHFDALKQFNNADWVPQTMQSRAVKDGDHTVLIQYAFMNRDTQINYLAASLPVSSFDSERRTFLGENEYGTWADPLSLQGPELNDSEALRGDNIGALMLHLDELKSGESVRFIVQLGQAASVEAALPDIHKYRDEAAVDAAFTGLREFWDGYLSTVQVQTPDASMNSMLNTHHPRQCHTTKNWSRYLSLYQLGLGARGIGVRDSSQDIMGVVAHMPDEARAFIKQILSVQTRAGFAMHQYNPLTMEAMMGDAVDDPDRAHYYSDDHLWTVLATCAYIRETGDLSLLDDAVPFYDKDRDGNPEEIATVMTHLERGVEFTRSDTGAHGLPLLGFADWNDTVNLLPGAESLFTANLYGVALRELIDLAVYMEDADCAGKFQGYYDEMKERVNAEAWDGAWYVRYFDPDGQPLGTHTASAGQIYTNAQSWPVMSGFATSERARQALDSLRERLNTASGIKVSTPGYDGFDPKVGGVSTFPPGAKENGGIFLHTNPWVMIAETMLGRGANAYEYYAQINPAARNDKIDEYEAEPYAYAQNILSDQHPHFGAGRNSWLSGTASWTYQAATQYILGVRPVYAGLLVDPCIPPEWDGFQMIRRYRGAWLAISVTNPNHVSKGVASLTVDGQPVTGNVIAPFTDGGQHMVEVVMG